MLGFSYKKKGEDKEMRIFVLTFCCVVLSGCLGAVRSSYTPYHTITQIDRTQTVAVVPGNKSLKSSLQFRAFKSKLEKRLKLAGFKVIGDPKTADLLAFLNYGIDGGKTKTHVGSTPVYGQTGGGTTSHSGTVSTYGSSGSGFGSYSGTSYTMPTYGVVGSSAYSYNVTTYARVLQLELLDRKSLDTNKISKIYEAKLSSKGSCSQISSVYDAMLTALFKDFPGKSGKSKRVDVDWDGEC